MATASTQAWSFGDGRFSFTAPLGHAPTVGTPVVVTRPDGRDLLVLVDRLLDILEDSLTLELILNVPRTLLGHRATTSRGAASVAGRLRRVLGHPRPQEQGHERNRQKFPHHTLQNHTPDLSAMTSESEPRRSARCT